ncbi:hypothetical protein [Pantoea sp. CCBC3-3-1]|uniref:hypothetical protein n=1 Tax=Pantoea sp. CCBC3-3-1 TaxID=2490851 RepID=UPI0011BEDBB7|nr:hypothetical protein [Pantoea sp. CCBC3-3-1]
MRAEHLAFLVVIAFAVLFAASLICSWVSYKKNLRNYERFLKKYREQGLFVDSITKVSEHLGFLFFYLKIAFFVRLLKNKKIYAAKGVLVDERCYRYIQSRPAEEVKWMWEWRRNYFIQSTLLCITLISCFIHSVVYNY